MNYKDNKKYIILEKLDDDENAFYEIFIVGHFESLKEAHFYCDLLEKEEKRCISQVKQIKNDGSLDSTKKNEIYKTIKNKYDSSKPYNTFSTYKKYEFHIDESREIELSEEERKEFAIQQLQNDI